MSDKKDNLIVLADRKRGRPSKEVLSEKAVVDIVRFLLADKGYTYNYINNAFASRGNPIDKTILNGMVNQYAAEHNVRVSRNAERVALQMLEDEAVDKIMSSIMAWEGALGKGESDDSLRQFLKLALRPDLTDSEFEFSVLSFKHWMWMVRRQLRNQSVNWQIALFMYSHAQGTGKSYFVRRLVKPLEHVSRMDASFAIFQDNFATEAFSRYYVMVFDEMVSADRADMNMLKKAITRETTEGRAMHSEKNRAAKAVASFIGATNTTLIESLNDSSMRRFVEIPWRVTKPTKEEFAAMNAIPVEELWGAVDPTNDEGYVAPNRELFEANQQKHATEDHVRYFLAQHLVPIANNVKVEPILLDAIHREYSEYCRLHRLPVMHLARLKARLSVQNVQFVTYPTGLTVCTSHVLVKRGDT